MELRCRRSVFLYLCTSVPSVSFSVPSVSSIVICKSNHFYKVTERVLREHDTRVLTRAHSAHAKHACLHACLRARAYARVHVHTTACVHACACSVYTFAHMRSPCARMQVHVLRTHHRILAHVCMHANAHSCTHTPVHICTLLPALTLLHACTFLHTPAYMAFFSQSITFQVH